MSYLKTLNSKDVIVTPFTVHKQFSYSGNPPGYSTSSVSQFSGNNSLYPNAGGLNGTGSIQLLGSSVNHLYYSNYFSGSNGQVSNVGTASFNPDGTVVGPAYTPNYINNIQSINDTRILSTTLTVLSIPSKIFGDYIKPGSFSEGGSDNLIDDGQGNLIKSSDGSHRGNIIYSSGVVIYSGSYTFSSPQWESSHTIYETQYKCTIRANEFNYSLNPSLLSSSIVGQNKILESGSADYADFVTGSDFSPYVTTVGLYNDNQELLAVAKLAQPLPTSQTTDTTILINLDR